MGDFFIKESPAQSFRNTITAINENTMMGSTEVCMSFSETGHG